MVASLHFLRGFTVVSALAAHPLSAAAAQEAPPPTLRWLGGSDAPPPPIELRHGEFAMVIEGTARRQRLRIELPGESTLGVLVVELLASPPSEPAAPREPERHEWLPHAGVAAASALVDGIVVTREALVSSARPVALVRWSAEGGFSGLRLWFEPNGDAVSARATTGSREPDQDAAARTASAAIDVTRGETRLRIEIDPVGGSVVAEGSTIEVRRPLAVAARIGAVPLPEVRSWTALTEAHVAARAARLGDFGLVLGAPETLEQVRDATVDERLRALREGASDPDLVATWLELARLRASDRLIATQDRVLGTVDWSMPESWLRLAAPSGADGARRRPADLNAAMLSVGRRDGDAALAVLRDRFTRGLGRDLLPVGAWSDPLDHLVAAGIVSGLLLHEAHGSIKVLPALPRVWPDGRLRRWRTSSGVEVDASWRDGRLEAGALTPADGGFVKVVLPPGDYECVAVPDAKPAPWPAADDGTREFVARAGRPFVFRRVR
jgi:hypothetical protein